MTFKNNRQDKISLNMPLTYLSVFNLNKDFTISDLEHSYNAKKKVIVENSSLSEADKEYFLENIHLLYRQAKHDYHKRELRIMNNTNIRNINFVNPVNHRRYRSLFDNLTNSFLEPVRLFDFPSVHDEWLSFRGLEPEASQSTFSSSSTSYREKTLPDGSRIVVNESITNKNGEVSRNTSSYRRLANGTTEAINYEDALKQLGNQQELKELL